MSTGVTLLERLRAPDSKQAWEEFDAIYRPIIRGFAAAWRPPVSADDVVQDCMVKLIELMPTFTYDAAGGFRRLLRTIVNNHIRNLLARRREALLGSGVIRDAADPTPPPDEALDQIEQMALMQYYLRQIRCEFRNAKTPDSFAMLLRGLSASEVASALDMTEAQVHTAKHRVTVRLKERLAQHDAWIG